MRSRVYFIVVLTSGAIMVILSLLLTLSRFGGKPRTRHATYEDCPEVIVDRVSEKYLNEIFRNATRSIFADTYRESFDKYETEREINVCAFVLIHHSSTEREMSFSMSFNGIRFNHYITHVYSINDCLPKHDLNNFIVYPDYVDYHTILKKVWWGLDYYGDKNCDFVVKYDADVQVFWDTLDFYLANHGPNFWYGRYKFGNEPILNPISRWYDNSFTTYTGRKAYGHLMKGGTYVIGKDLLRCIVKEGRKRVSRERNNPKEKQWLNLHNEDVGVGFLVDEGKCETEIVPCEECFYGKYLKEFSDAHWIGVVSTHTDLPGRQSYRPLFHTI